MSDEQKANDKLFAKGVLLSTTVLTTVVLIILTVITKRFFMFFFVILFHLGVTCYICYILEHEHPALKHMGGWVDDAIKKIKDRNKKKEETD
jgi:type IV secretory pathway VirB3-like protein